MLPEKDRIEHGSRVRFCRLCLIISKFQDARPADQTERVSTSCQGLNSDHASSFVSVI